MDSVNNLPLQACMPSPHVWPKLESPTSPHFLNQAPPRAQQLRLPDFLVVPHLGHPSVLCTNALVVVGRSGTDALVVVGASADMTEDYNNTIDTDNDSPYRA